MYMVVKMSLLFLSLLLKLLFMGGLRSSTRTCLVAAFAPQSRSETNSPLERDRISTFKMAKDGKVADDSDGDKENISNFFSNFFDRLSGKPDEQPNYPEEQPTPQPNIPQEKKRAEETPPSGIPFTMDSNFPDSSGRNEENNTNSALWSRVNYTPYQNLGLIRTSNSNSNGESNNGSVSTNSGSYFDSLKSSFPSSLSFSSNATNKRSENEQQQGASYMKGLTSSSDLTDNQTAKNQSDSSKSISTQPPLLPKLQVVENTSKNQLQQEIQDLHQKNKEAKQKLWEEQQQLALEQQIDAAMEQTINSNYSSAQQKPNTITSNSNASSPYYFGSKIAKDISVSSESLVDDPTLQRKLQRLAKEAGITDEEWAAEEALFMQEAGLLEAIVEEEARLKGKISLLSMKRQSNSTFNEEFEEAKEEAILLLIVKEDRLAEIAQRAVERHLQKRSQLQGRVNLTADVQQNSIAHADRSAEIVRRAAERHLAEKARLAEFAKFAQKQLQVEEDRLAQLAREVAIGYMEEKQRQAKNVQKLQTERKQGATVSGNEENRKPNGQERQKELTQTNETDVAEKNEEHIDVEETQQQQQNTDARNVDQNSEDQTKKQPQQNNGREQAQKEAVKKQTQQQQKQGTERRDTFETSSSPSGRKAKVPLVEIQQTAKDIGIEQEKLLDRQTIQKNLQELARAAGITDDELLAEEAQLTREVALLDAIVKEESRLKGKLSILAAKKGIGQKEEIEKMKAEMALLLIVKEEKLAEIAQKAVEEHFAKKEKMERDPTTDEQQKSLMEEERFVRIARIAAERHLAEKSRLAELANPAEGQIDDMEERLKKVTIAAAESYLEGKDRLAWEVKQLNDGMYNSMSDLLAKNKTYDGQLETDGTNLDDNYRSQGGNADIVLNKDNGTDVVTSFTQNSYVGEPEMAGKCDVTGKTDQAPKAQQADPTEGNGRAVVSKKIQQLAETLGMGLDRLDKKAKTIKAQQLAQEAGILFDEWQAEESQLSEDIAFLDAIVQEENSLKKKIAQLNNQLLLDPSAKMELQSAKEEAILLLIVKEERLQKISRKAADEHNSEKARLKQALPLNHSKEQVVAEEDRLATIARKAAERHLAEKSRLAEFAKSIQGEISAETGISIAREAARGQLNEKEELARDVQAFNAELDFQATEALKISQQMNQGRRFKLDQGVGIRKPKIGSEVEKIAKATGVDLERLDNEARIIKTQQLAKNAGISYAEWQVEEAELAKEKAFLDAVFKEENRLKRKISDLSVQQQTDPSVSKELQLTKEEAVLLLIVKEEKLAEIARRAAETHLNVKRRLSSESAVRIAEEDRLANIARTAAERHLEEKKRLADLVKAAEERIQAEEDKLVKIATSYLFEKEKLEQQIAAEAAKGYLEEKQKLAAEVEEWKCAESELQFSRQARIADELRYAEREQRLIEDRRSTQEEQIRLAAERKRLSVQTERSASQQVADAKPKDERKQNSKQENTLRLASLEKVDQLAEVMGVELRKLDADTRRWKTQQIARDAGISFDEWQAEEVQLESEVSLLDAIVKEENRLKTRIGELSRQRQLDPSLEAQFEQAKEEAILLLIVKEERLAEVARKAAEQHLEEKKKLEEGRTPPNSVLVMEEDRLYQIARSAAEGHLEEKRKLSLQARALEEDRLLIEESRQDADISDGSSSMNFLGIESDSTLETEPSLISDNSTYDELSPEQLVQSNTPPSFFTAAEEYPGGGIRSYRPPMKPTPPKKPPPFISREESFLGSSSADKEQPDSYPLSNTRRGRVLIEDSKPFVNRDRYFFSNQETMMQKFQEMQKEKEMAIKKEEFRIFQTKLKNIAGVAALGLGLPLALYVTSSLLSVDNFSITDGSNLKPNQAEIDNSKSSTASATNAEDDVKLSELSNEPEVFGEDTVDPDDGSRQFFNGPMRSVGEETPKGPAVDDLFTEDSVKLQKTGPHHTSDTSDVRPNDVVPSPENELGESAIPSDEKVDGVEISPKDVDSSLIAPKISQPSLGPDRTSMKPEPIPQDFEAPSDGTIVPSDTFESSPADNSLAETAAASPNFDSTSSDVVHLLPTSLKSGSLVELNGISDSNNIEDRLKEGTQPSEDDVAPTPSSPDKFEESSFRSPENSIPPSVFSEYAENKDDVSGGVSLTHMVAPSPIPGAFSSSSTNEPMDPPLADMVAPTDAQNGNSGERIAESDESSGRTADRNKASSLIQMVAPITNPDTKPSLVGRETTQMGSINKATPPSEEAAPRDAPTVFSGVYQGPLNPEQASTSPEDTSSHETEIEDSEPMSKDRPSAVLESPKVAGSSSFIPLSSAATPATGRHKDEENRVKSLPSTTTASSASLTDVVAPKEEALGLDRTATAAKIPTTAVTSFSTGIMRAGNVETSGEAGQETLPLSPDLLKPRTTTAMKPTIAGELSQGQDSNQLKDKFSERVESIKSFAEQQREAYIQSVRQQLESRTEALASQAQENLAQQKRLRLDLPSNSVASIQQGKAPLREDRTGSETPENTLATNHQDLPESGENEQMSGKVRAFVKPSVQSESPLELGSEPLSDKTQPALQNIRSNMESKLDPLAKQIQSTSKNIGQKIGEKINFSNKRGTNAESQPAVPTNEVGASNQISEPSRATIERYETMVHNIHDNIGSKISPFVTRTQALSKSIQDMFGSIPAAHNPELRETLLSLNTPLFKEPPIIKTNYFVQWADRFDQPWSPPALSATKLQTADHPEPTISIPEPSYYDRNPSEKKDDPTTAKVMDGAAETGAVGKNIVSRGNLFEVDDSSLF